MEIRPDPDSPIDSMSKTPFILREPLAPIIETTSELNEFSEFLSKGIGPIALDTERASGFRYRQSAYLIQVRRENVGTRLIDPIDILDFSLFAKSVNQIPWVMHAAMSDIPCLAELGLRPKNLFDTEVAGRLLGRAQVSLSGLVRSELGEVIVKGQGATDWSKRPLTAAQLQYAALDVELLLELCHALKDALKLAEKLEWAKQEFEYLISFEPKPSSTEPWRGTTGIHRVKDSAGLQVVKELWNMREEIARFLNLARGRLFRDEVIIELAILRPKTINDLRKIAKLNKKPAINYLKKWWSALEKAYTELEGLNTNLPNTDSLPQIKSWEKRNPKAFKRYEFIKSGLLHLAQEFNLPVENIITPEIARRFAWDSEEITDIDTFLTRNKVRSWQMELVRPILRSAKEIPA